jgi:hypothetical protein
MYGDSRFAGAAFEQMWRRVHHWRKSLYSSVRAL